MGAAAYNRGSRAIAAQIAGVANDKTTRARMARAAEKDEAERLRSRVTELERENARARRSIGSLRATLAQERADRRAEAETDKLARMILAERADRAERRWRWCSRVIRAALSPAEYHRTRQEIEDADGEQG